MWLFNRGLDASIKCPNITKLSNRLATVLVENTNFCTDRKDMLKILRVN